MATGLLTLTSFFPLENKFLSLQSGWAPPAEPVQGPLLPTTLLCIPPQCPGWWTCLGWAPTALPLPLLPCLHAWTGCSNPFTVPGPPRTGVASPSQGWRGATCPLFAVTASGSHLSRRSNPVTCRDPRGDRGCPRGLGRETVQSCPAGSHQNAQTNGHAPREARTEDDPRNTLVPKKRCSTGPSK